MRQKAATLNIPLANLRPLYRNDKSKTLIFEAPVEALRDINDATTLDEVIAQARLDYALGDYESFDDVEDLIKDLNS